MLQSVTVDLGTAGSYNIKIGAGAIYEAADYLWPFVQDGEKLVVVSDKTVWGLYGDTLLDAMKKAGIEAVPVSIVIRPGEESKNLSTLGRIFESFSEAGLARGGTVIAFGGGVVGDIAGFAAATWMRGVRYVQIPTTLLAQVDSSVGGKTAIDIEAGKNLVGAFHQPSLVIADTDFLKMLDDRQFNSGMAEVIKTGAVASTDLIEKLELRDAREIIDDIVTTCVKKKARVVEQDEKENDIRKILNFGHSLGHAIEARGGFSKYTHGEAVAMGMVLACEMGVRLDITGKKAAARLWNLLNKYDLVKEENTEGLIQIVKHDKKANADGISFVFLKELGESAVYEVEFDEIEELLAEIRKEKAEEIADSKTVNLFPSGTITAPPSKSISHRAVICAYLAGVDEDKLENLGNSLDIAATIAGMKKIAARDNGTPIDCGESGSTLRFLLPIAAMTGDDWTFSGRGRLMDRPHDVFREVFERHGAYYTQDDFDGRDIHVRGPFHHGRFSLPGDVSSQFVTGLLFALPLLEKDSEISLTTTLESAAYVDLTIATLKSFGVRIDENLDADGAKRGFIVKGSQKYVFPDDGYTIEGDYSQAAFFLAAAALGRPVRVSGLSRDSEQGDRRIVSILRRMGAGMNWIPDQVWNDGGLVRNDDGIPDRVRNDNVLEVVPPVDGLVAMTIDAREIPDLVPVLASLACFCKGRTSIINAGRLRLKESDRLAATAEELTKLGADITEEEDAIKISGKGSLSGGTVSAHNDHRLAMALAVAAIRAEGEVKIVGADSVSKSYPNFWVDFEKVER
ncbi:MAG: 3-dehydroquinate synthase [Clostridiales Family XIII bacterium]|jgi:3-dehydroquinate synthase/3-phosphoshikimate 1-carboxyvinyltransferase|nr:3-dehydroquinate synthase [Clostridiales Family XIII bacterium]